ncbi:methyltransferase domain-containing protein [Candidatus Woesearchaeota archaeon]|nr:MAG: methyltransferase domain-containing protein [Candidatus Woesearchaeota archaeon]
MFKLETENSIKFYSPKNEVITKSLPVFYNKEMKLARDVTTYIINQLKPSRILDSMCATGIRSIRIAKECNVKEIVANDINPLAIKLTKKNAKLNKVSLSLSNKNLNILLYEEKPFDYIDIDPFGSPVIFIEPAISNIKNNGILAITATDLGPLYGRHPSTCRRRYNCIPLNNYFRKELAARILIYRSQIIASSHDKSLIPVFVDAGQYYIRVYFKCTKSKSNKVFKQHKHLFYNSKNLEYSFDYFPESTVHGPFYIGSLWDKSLTQNFNLIKYLKDESTLDVFGYYDIHKICKKFKLSSKIKISTLIDNLKSSGYKASRTHFSPQGIRSNIEIKELINHLT